MSRAFRIVLAALGAIAVACHQQPPVQKQPPVRKQPPVQKEPPVQKQPPVQTQAPVERPPDVRPDVKKDTPGLVVIRDPSVVVFFRDTVPNVLSSARGRAFDLQKTEERQDLRTAIRRERERWRSRKPANYRFLLRVGCFCPGTRGWLLMEVRSGEPLRAWDRTGQSVPLTDWNTLSIDGLFANLEHAAEKDGHVQIAFDRRLHFPTYIRTSAARVPDAWSISEARALTPLRARRLPVTKTR